MELKDPGGADTAMRASYPAAAPTSSAERSNLSAANLAGFEPQVFIRTLHFTNGDVYEGETVGNLRHGQGKHTCSNGDTHEGGWYKGMRHGPGVACFARGFHFEGDFEYDHAQGSGKARYETGAVFEGEFECDQRSGWGTQCFPDESVYVGEWAKDKITGKGRLMMKDGSFFEGTWRNGQRLTGKWVSADRKQEYLGAWQGDKQHGEGTLHIEGLLQYTGEWRNGLQHGQGRMRWVDGSVYNGQWKEGKRHGRGVMSRADGYKYDGPWHSDKEHGSGNARFENGERYTGDFRDGVPCGRGRTTSPNGERYSGDFADGKRHGFGRCIYKNGDKYQGEWVAGKRHGEGSCKFADGTLFQGEWQEDSWLQTEAEPSLSAVAGRGLGQAVAGKEASFTILARDAISNKRLAGGDSFVAWLEGPATVHAAVADNSDGSYTVTYCTTIAGTYELYVTNDTGESVAESPYPLRVVPAPPQARSSIIRLPRPSVAPGQPAVFEVEAHDEFGNRCLTAALAGGLPIECSVSDGRRTYAVDVKPVRGGCYRCTFMPVGQGFYRVNVLSNERPLSNSPASLKVASPADDAEGPADAARVNDSVAEWAAKAAQHYGLDGDMAGWDSEDDVEETEEQKYIKKHPEVPVVENLQDMWKVTKLQRERKAREERQKALQELQELKLAGREPANASEYGSWGTTTDEAVSLVSSVQQSSASGKDSLKARPDNDKIDCTSSRQPIISGR